MLDARRKQKKQVPALTESIDQRREVHQILLGLEPQTPHGPPPASVSTLVSQLSLKSPQSLAHGPATSLSPGELVYNAYFWVSLQSYRIKIFGLLTNVPKYFWCHKFSLHILTVIRLYSVCERGSTWARMLVCCGVSTGFVAFRQDFKYRFLQLLLCFWVSVTSSPVHWRTVCDSAKSGLPIASFGFFI